MVGKLRRRHIGAFTAEEVDEHLRVVSPRVVVGGAAATHEVMPDHSVLWPLSLEVLHAGNQGVLVVRGDGNVSAASFVIRRLLRADPNTVGGGRPTHE